MLRTGGLVQLVVPQRVPPADTEVALTTDAHCELAVATVTEEQAAQDWVQDWVQPRLAPEASRASVQPGLLPPGLHQPHGDPASAFHASAKHHPSASAATTDLLRYQRGSQGSDQSLMSLPRWLSLPGS